MHTINSIFCSDGSLPVTFSPDDQIALLSEIDCLLSILDSTGALEIIDQVKCIRKFHEILYNKYLRDCEASEYYEEEYHNSCTDCAYYDEILDRCDYKLQHTGCYLQQ